MTSDSLSSLNKAPLLKRAKAMQTRLKRQDSFIQTMFILSSSSIFALMQGVQVLRVHDVNEINQSIKVFKELIK